MTKTFIWTGIVSGSIIGGFVPLLWGAGVFSGWSIITSGIGSLAGIWIGVKVSKM